MEATRRIETRTVEVDGRQAPVRFRSDSAGDAAVVRHIFDEGEYAVDQWMQGKLLRQLYDHVVRSGMTPLIVDAGANIGASALYYTLTYPEATVLAIEPEPNNVRLLESNCAGRNVRIVEGAVGSEHGSLFLTDPGQGDWGFRVEASGEREVRVFSMEHLLTDFDRSKVFPLVCKIDIEGGEARLFEKNTGWVDGFPLIAIELHDWMLPFRGTSRNFLKVLGACEFEVIQRGETLFCFNASFFPRAE